MIDVSIIIVNYNVKQFLLQALDSVYKSQGVSFEVFVVDNNSTDQSMESVKELFPSVQRIENKTNLGFGRANNQALAKAKGKYTLFLNPDTVIEENTLFTCFQAMESNECRGALGVRMVDGQGKFLPESKRGLPTLWSSLCKFAGLYKIAPTSSWLNGYYAGHLPEHENNTVDVLTGAFFFGRRELIQKIGGFDEDFFMYGEDVDLSHRVQLEGKDLHYLGGTTIIHYKGESTKKRSFNYAFSFFDAMGIFAEKHTFHRWPRIIKRLMRSLFQGVALLFYMIKVTKRILPALAELLMVYGSFFSVSTLYARYLKPEIGQFPNEFLLEFLPAYSMVYFLSLLLSGAYAKHHSLRSFLAGSGIALIAITFIYGLLPETLRFSRGSILAGWGVAGLLGLAIRSMLYLRRHRQEKARTQKALFVGRPTTFKTFQDASVHGKSAIQINLSDILGIEDLAQIHGASKIILCAESIPSRTMIESIGFVGGRIPCYIYRKESDSLVGNFHRNRSRMELEEPVDLNLNLIRYRAYKQLTDILISSCILLLGCTTIPLLSHEGRKKITWAFAVIWGKKTWVGYHKPHSIGLPIVKEAWTTCALLEGKTGENVTKEQIITSNFLYAKNYHPLDDIRALISKK
ncbi:MAG: glycosyltransferase [Bacteroidetes bacterium]|nr:MAG: glycosyltransferase [Bacteroidota bacterium]